MNNYDEIARSIDEALAAFIGNAHEPRSVNGDSITMTKDGFITGVIRFQRLRDWAEGLAQTHRYYRKVTTDLDYWEEVVTLLRLFVKGMHQMNDDPEYKAIFDALPPNMRDLWQMAADIVGEGEGLI